MTGKAWLQNLKSAHTAQQDWLTWLRSVLPEDLREAPLNAIPKAHELVVMTASAAWSTRLRYALAGIEAQLQARAPHMKRVTVRVAPPEQRPDAPSGR